MDTLPFVRISTHLAGNALLEDAVLETLAYSDVFDYPLTLAQIRRYLIGMQATVEEVRLAAQANLAVGRIEQQGEYLALAGRGAIFETRSHRQALAAQLWPRALRYGRWLARLPFVRMVAVTGALAMDNEDQRDLDFLVVTQSGRLWTCRGLAMLLVRRAALSGDELCPNYFISERALVFPSHDLYTAHELMQMTPLYGLDVYWQMRHLNDWADDLLPNAAGLPRPDLPVVQHAAWRQVQPVAEAILRTAPGGWLEAWERRRKIRMLEAQRRPDSEVDFGPEWCKGHFGGYGGRSLAAYDERMKTLGVSKTLRG